MIDIKRFSGVMNLDDREQDLLPAQHRSAKNIRFYGGDNGLTAENIKGNYFIPNSSLPETGVNECIGCFYDSVNRIIFFFNYNSAGNNGIYKLSLQTEVVTPVFISNTNSASDILNFNLDYPIHSVQLVYRTLGDGDLLYWTDGYNRPKYINVATVLALSPFTADMLYAAKSAPLSPPTFPAAANTNGVFGYFSDPTVAYNSVRNKLFRFSYRWVYKNGEKSTFSPISIVPLPLLLDPNIQYDITLFNYIKFIVYSPNEQDYQAIEVFGQLSTGTTWGDFFLIDSLDRDQYGIAVNSSFTYSFYNNSSYIFVDPQESDLYYDWLPDKANTLELLNGNVIIYGGITDGYPNLSRSEVDVTVTSSVASLDPLLVTIPNVCPVFKWGCQEKLGLMYFDERGKTNGVVSFIGDAIDTTDFAVTTPDYPGQNPLVTIQVPKISASINHLPPSWAASYQWVRVDLTPKFLHWVTNDYLTDNQYLYLGIEALVQMNAKSGFIPSYEYSPGDRVRILAKFTGDNSTTAFTEQQDFPILGVVQKIMTSPATLGAFIKIQKPSSFPTPSYSAAMLIEVYTPKPKTPDNQQLYYEWGQKFDIYTSLGIRYHMGQTQNQTASQPALFEWTEGDVYLKRRGFFLAVPIENNILYSYLDMMDANWNDYVATASNQNGRAWIINENAATVYNPVLLRWGGKYQQGTNINALNRFRPNDLDEIDRAKGDIRRLKARDRILRVFQDRGVGQFGVYARFIQNNEGIPELVTTNEIITTNNINYYQGTVGLGGYPTNLCSGTIADYFNDVVTGREQRLSADGITDLGLLYKGQFELAKLVIPYNKVLLRSNGSIAKVMKFWDSFENESHTILQSVSGNPSREIFVLSFSSSPNKFVCAVTSNFFYVGGTYSITGTASNNITFTITEITIGLLMTIATDNNFNNELSISATFTNINTLTLPDRNYSFNESRNAFCCDEYDEHPEWAISADDTIYFFKQGQIWKKSDQAPYCNFFGVQYDCSITVVFNLNINEKKSWQNITEVANSVWECPNITTDINSYGSIKQRSTLVPSEFKILEGMPSASFKRDINSRGGKINGQFLKGSYMIVKFQITNASNLVTLSQLINKYIESPLNVR